MKLLVFGGRTFADNDMLVNVLNTQHQQRFFTHLIEGGAQGADRLAYYWALKRGLQTVRCIANWGFYGPAAGPVRNRAMGLLKPDLGIGFPGGAGSASMESICRELCIPVLLVDGKGELS